MQTIFDENGLLNISDIVKNHPSYKTIMEDGVIIDQELKEQADATIASLHKLQSICTEEQQSAIIDTISEMGVLFVAYHNYQLKAPDTAQAVVNENRGNTYAQYSVQTPPSISTAASNFLTTLASTPTVAHP